MADNIDVNVNVNTSTASRNLDNLNKQVNGLSSSFGKLRNALAGVAFTSIINNALNFAASLVDISKSTDIALESVLGFSRAVQANGGSLADAQSALQKFNITIGEAAQGSATLQTAFQNVGVSLTDLRNLSQTDLLQKTIQGLAKIKDASERAKVANELLGKSFKGIDVLGLANDYAKAVEESRKYAASIRTADQVQQNVETSFTNLQIALLATLKPIGDLAKSITTNINQLQRWISAILAFAEVLATFFIIGRIIKLLGLLGGGLLAIVRNLGAAKEAFKKLFQEAGDTKAIATITVKYKELIKLLEEGNFAAFRFAVRLKKVLEGFANLALGIGGAILSYLGITKAIDKFNQVLNQQNLDEIVDYIDQLNESSTEAWMIAQENARAQREVTDALAKQAEAIRQTSVAYKEQNAEVLRNLDLQKEQLTTSADEYELQTALIDNSERLRKALEDLQKQRNEAAADPEKSSLVAVYDQEMNKIRESAVVTAEAVQQKIKELQALRDAQADVVRQNELMKQSMESDLQLQQLRDQIELIGLFGQELEDQQLILEVSQNLERELLDLRKQELDLIAKKGQLTEEQFQKELAYIDQLRTAASSRANAELEIKRQQKEKERELEDDYMKGVEKALKDIADQYKPINVAQEAVRKGWNRIEDAIDTFVETGKFKFSDFARSVIQDLAKMIAKAMIFKAISAALGAFGIKIPGLATGGPAEAGKPYIVGEKGPELFVPQNSGRVIPNNQLGKGMNAGAVSAPVTNNYNTYNINALDAKSVAQVFAENRKAIFGANKMAEREMSYVGAR